MAARSSLSVVHLVGDVDFGESAASAAVMVCAQRPDVLEATKQIQRELVNADCRVRQEHVA